MQAIKDTLNGLMGRPRRQLDTNWVDVQTRKQNQQPYAASLLNFLAAFIRAMQGQQPIDTVFSHRDELLQELVSVVGDLENKIVNTSREADHRLVIQALLFVNIDILQSESSQVGKRMRDYLTTCEKLCLHVQVESDYQKMRQTLLLFQFLLSKVEGLKSQSVREGHFNMFLDCIESKNDDCQALLLNFFEIELATFESDKERSRWSLLQDSGLHKNNLTFKNLLKNVKHKLLNEIPGEYQQQLFAERASDRLSQQAEEKRFTEPHPFELSTLQDDQPLPREFLQQIREERGDSQMRSSLPPSPLAEQNQAILSELRSGGFMSGIKERLKTCADDKLQVYTMLAYILNSFSAANWAESELDLLPTLMNRLQKPSEASETIVGLFKEILLAVVTNGLPETKKIRNLNMFRFLQKCILQCHPKVRDALCLELKSFLAANKVNPAIFLKEKGFEWLRELPLSDAVIDLVNYALFVLSNEQTECQHYLAFLAKKQLTEQTEERHFVYNLLEKYFAKPRDSSAELFALSMQLYQKDQENAFSLLASCTKHFMAQDQLCFQEFDPALHALELSKSDCFIRCYLAAQLIKCQLHAGADVDLLRILAEVSSRAKMTFLRLLFVPCNNPYSGKLKDRHNSQLLEAQWSLFTEAVGAQDYDAALDSFITMTILVSGSDMAKRSLDRKMLECRREIEGSLSWFCAGARQGDLVQCILELCTEGLNDESNALVWDYLTHAECEEFTSFVGTTSAVAQESQVLIRDIDYSLMLRILDQLTSDSLIVVLQKMRECASCFCNKQTLIKSNFQPFLLAQLEKKHPVSLTYNQQLYFRQANLALFSELLAQGIVPMNVQDLLKPNLLPIVLQVLSQNPAPASFNQDAMTVDTKSIALKQDRAICDVNVLFKTSSNQEVILSRHEVHQNPEEGDYNDSLQWTYSLTVDSHQTFALDLWIELGLYELGGWNTYSVEADTLVVNGQQTTLKVSGSIASASQVLYESAASASEHGQMTLKELMSNQETILVLVQQIDKARGDDSIINLFRLITALVTKNCAKLTFDIENLIQVKMMEIHTDRMLEILKALVDLALDQVDGHLRLELTDDQFSESLIPQLVLPEKLALPLKLLAQVPAEVGSKLIELIQLLLTDSQNLRIFHQTFGVEPVLRIMTLIRDSSRKQSLYDRTLRLYELFIDGVRLGHLPNGVLQTILDFLLEMALVPEAKPATKRIVIDCLAVVMIHLIVDETKQFLPKILELTIVDFVYKILQSAIEEVREYSFKVICLLLTQEPASKAKFCFDTITDLLKTQAQSMSMCTTILDASTGKYMNVNDLCPTDDALVIQMMNASRSALKIVSQIKQSFQQTRKTAIIYQEMVDCFLAALGCVANDVSRHMCLKQFTTMLFEHNNIEVIFDSASLHQLISSIFTLQIAVTQHDELSYTAKKFYENYLFDRFSQTSTHAGGYSTTEDDPLHTSGNKSGSAGNQEAQFPTRTLDAVLDLLAQIVVKDLYRPSFQAEVFNIMLTHPFEDDRLQLQIISRILKHFHRHPKIDDKCVLSNLYRIFAGMDKLMAENVAISLKVINLVNLIAFKSSTEVRKLMKENKLLELRDKLMVDQIRKTYMQSSSEFLVTALSKFSFDAIASKPVFTQNCCTEYLLLLAGETKFASAGAELRQRLESEVCQYDANSERVSGLLKLQTASKSVSLDTVRQRVKQHLDDQMEIRGNFDKERAMRRLILVEERAKAEAQRKAKTAKHLA